MEFIKRLREQRANAWEQAKDILDAAAAESRDLTAEEDAAFAKANADIDAIDQRVKALEEAEQRSADAEAAFAALESRTPTRPAPQAGDELRSFLRGETRTFVAKPTVEELRDLTKGSATAGGNTVPTSFYGMLWAHLIETATVAGISTVLNTDSGENIEVPVTTSHSSGALVTEGSAISESDPAFAKRTLGAYKYGALIQVSRELVDDTGVDLEGYLAMQAGRAVGNALGAHLATGSGSSQPAGVVTGSSLGVTGSASVSGAFSADNLIDLHYSVIEPYRRSTKCGWLMRDATVGAARKLKGSDNNYLWQPGLQIGAPDMLLGKPVYADPNIDAVALSAKSVLFGDFAAYFTRIAGGVRFERSDEYAFNADLVTFRAVVRGDGILADQTGAVKHFIGNAA